MSALFGSRRGAHPDCTVRNIRLNGVVCNAIQKILATGYISPSQLLVDVKNLEHEKWDWAFPLNVLEKSYTSSALEPELALVYLTKIINKV